MKYTIEGFSQEQAIRMKLDLKDLVFLRWLVDFYNTGIMEIHMFDGRPYFWIDYRYVLQQLPILGINSKDVLARRLKHMSTAGVLEFKLFEGAGNKTYFRFKEKSLRALLTSNNPSEKHDTKSGSEVREESGDSKSQVEKASDPDQGGSDSKVGRVSDPNEESSDPKVGRVPTEESEGFRPKSRNQYDSSINDSSIIDSSLKAQQEKPAASQNELPYPPPTQEQKNRLQVLSVQLGSRFNVYQFMQKVKNQLGYPPPVDVMIKASENFLKYPNIDNPWGWFINVVKAESGAFFADLNIREHERIKKEPASLAKIFAGLGNNISTSLIIAGLYLCGLNF